MGLMRGCAKSDGRIQCVALSTVDVDSGRVCGAVGGHVGDAVVRPWLRIFLPYEHNSDRNTSMAPIPGRCRAS